MFMSDQNRKPPDLRFQVNIRGTVPQWRKRIKERRNRQSIEIEDQVKE